MKKIMKKIKLLSLTVSVLFVSNYAIAQLTPPSAQVTQVQIDGSGCDAQSANALITSDLNYLSVLYDRFSAEIGKGTADKNSKAQEKRCTILVDISVPQGWTFTFDTIDYRGYVEVPNKAAAAYQIVTAEIQGGASLGFEQKVFQGPVQQNYIVTVKNQSPAFLNKLSCFQNNQTLRVKIKSTIGVRNLLAGLVKPAVKIVVDSTDASFKQSLRFNWKRCF